MSIIQVSIIIPTFNRSGMLIQTLNSLLLQDFPKEYFEVIIVDNNSKDDTKQVIKKYIEDNHNKLNIKYTIEKRQGDIYARHTGAYHAIGEILIFTDDDATFDTNWISEIVFVFKKFPSVGAVGTRISIKWDKKPPTWILNYESLLGKITYGENYTVQETGLFINNGSLAILKKVFKEVNGNNPGQLKSFLVGDAEVGLCKKLHERKIPIAFTDNTTMWHHQFVRVNGTLKDIMRRVANNGIVQAYNDIVVCNNKPSYFIKEFFIQLLVIFKSICTVKRAKILNSILTFHQLRYRFIFNKRFRKDEVLIKMLNNRDWLFNEHYIGSKLIYDYKIN